MGLDMFGFTVDAADAVGPFTIREGAPRDEIAYWRKHPNTHGWMEALYRKKGGDAESFNCVDVQLTAEDLDAFEAAVNGDALPVTRGFFFGESYPEDKALDLAFIEKARAALADGKVVVYSSWW